MNSERDRPRTISRLWVRTASVHTHARIKRGLEPWGELIDARRSHHERVGAVAPDIPNPVAGVGARQGAERHCPRQEPSIRGCFAGPDKSVYLIGKGEGAAVSAERLDVAGVRGSFGEIGQDRSGRRQPAFTQHGFIFPQPSDKTGERMSLSPASPSWKVTSAACSPSSHPYYPDRTLKNPCGGRQL